MSEAGARDYFNPEGLGQVMRQPGGRSAPAQSARRRIKASLLLRAVDCEAGGAARISPCLRSASWLRSAAAARG
ncbi:MAG TPA: hypothetical protein VGX92_05045 [Pyrinomonadaceae bacterium]|nr:hypothetical protein [Pyrinomonadaceae bacterium]